MREDSSSYVFPLDDTTMPTDIYIAFLSYFICLLTALISLLPHLGSIVGIAWCMYLMFLATEEVHQLNVKTASRYLSS